MFSFEFRFDDYRLLLNELAQRLNVTVNNDTIIFPEHLAKGYFRLLDLPNGLQVNLINCTFNSDWCMHRRASAEQFYTLRFDEFSVPGSLIVSIDHDKQKETASARSIIYLTSSLFDFYYQGTKGTSVRAINILIKPEWISNYLGLENVDDLLTNYVALKAESLNIQTVDREYQSMMNEILYKDPEHSFSNLYLLNRLQLLIERFFTNLYHRSQKANLNLRLSNADINRLMQVAHSLSENFSGKPPAITQLARMSAMSPTKFKMNFKSIYGQPVYSFYQEQRLQKAREYLLSGNYNVNEAAAAVAYDNTSNFITAFKKQFHTSPGELIKNK
ncbi:MAG: AraC family transcriptional regulator [Ferruginibacter sp.]